MKSWSHVECHLQASSHCVPSMCTSAQKSVHTQHTCMQYVTVCIVARCISILIVFTVNLATHAHVLVWPVHFCLWLLIHWILECCKIPYIWWLFVLWAFHCLRAKADCVRLYCSTSRANMGEGTIVCLYWATVPVPLDAGNYIFGDMNTCWPPCYTI